jgi:predicted DCC family thiol-disulfide oxidoreductase YuxK
VAIDTPLSGPGLSGNAARGAGVAAEQSGTSLTVLYDSGCGVCCETVRRLRRWDRDGRLEFLPLTQAAGSGRPILERLATEGHLDDEIHVVNEATGEVVCGGHAALALLDALPGGWLLRPWASMPHTAAAADVVYRVASRHRDRLAWLMGMRNEVSCPLGPSAGAGHAKPPAAESKAQE